MNGYGKCISFVWIAWSSTHFPWRRCLLHCVGCYMTILMSNTFITRSSWCESCRKFSVWKIQIFRSVWTKISALFVCCRLPWNQATLWGYLTEMSFNALNFECFLIANGVIMLLFMFICYHHQAFSSMLKSSIAKIDCTLIANKLDRKDLCDLIEFHISIKA